MLIVCPSCASEYVIDPDRIGSGRIVRCAACRATWQAEGPKHAAGPVLSGTDLDATRASVEPPPLVSKGQPGGPVAASRFGANRFFVAICVLFVLAMPAGVALRRPIVGVVPGSAGLFAAVGLPVNLAGLELEGVRSSLVQDSGKPVLLVEGRIRNPGRDTTTVPPVEIAIEGEDGEPLYNWSTRPLRSELDPGESLPFGARLASPPPLGRRVVVTLASARSAAVASR